MHCLWRDLPAAPSGRAHPKGRDWAGQRGFPSRSWVPGRGLPQPPGSTPLPGPLPLAEFSLLPRGRARQPQPQEVLWPRPS